MTTRVSLLLIIAFPVLFSCTKKDPEPEPEVRVQSVSVSNSSAEMKISETLQLTASVSPAAATNKEITWSSSQPSVATVSPSGLVTAIGEGTATITASADGMKAECAVSVKKAYVAVSEVKLDKAEMILYEGDETILTVSVLPGDATDKTISWSSSDKAIATVESGKVKAIKEGTAMITASAGIVKAECKVSVLMKYAAVAITDLKPVDILPFVGQVEVGDKKAYDHIEHLRIAEATRIRDMMWEYGAGTHSKEEYQQLMGRLNVGMTREVPLGFDNYEMIGPETTTKPDDHAHTEWHTLVTLVKYANFKVVSGVNKGWYGNLTEHLRSFPNSINIFGNSAYPASSSKELLTKSPSFCNDVFDLCNENNVVIFVAGTNIDTYNAVIRNKIYNWDYEADEHGWYSFASLANSDKNSRPESHLFVTVATDSDGDIDQTSEIYESSRYPVGFHKDVLFSGRSFPYHSTEDGTIHAKSGKIPTSHANYVNVALMGICFQLYAKVKDVDELLEMVKSTCLTDYIRFDLNGDGDMNDIVEGQPESQPLQLINPAGLYKKYLTPQDVPTTISLGETLPLDKGYYKGILFSIPGAEVKINGDWVAFDNKNKDVILSQNPMDLEWRLNGDLLKKYGYSSGQTVEGQVITVDDMWGGLRLEVPMTVTIQ